jgi:hypothetical protein
MANSWLLQSFLAVLLLTPAWLAMPFFSKNYGVSGSVFAVWYFLGVSLSIGLFQGPAALKPSIGVIIGIVVAGVVFGGVANSALFSAVNAAPNPGIPIAISTVSSLTTFIAAVALFRFMPEYFAPAALDWKSFAGAILIIAGATLISVK